jgi:hypothetical protein
LRFADVQTLNTNGYTLTDVAKFTFQREYLLAGEHLRNEIKSSFKLDHMRSSLEAEKAKTQV